MPNTAVEATGRPNAIASSIERGSDSTSEAQTSTSQAWYQRWMSGWTGSIRMRGSPSPST